MTPREPIDGKVYTVPEEKTKVLAADSAPKKRELPEALRKNIWKPGQSGNPAGGRTKGLRHQVKKFLTRKVPSDPQGRMYLEKLVEAMVKRAIKKPDVLVKEIFDRAEGKVPTDPAAAAQYGAKIIIAETPGPLGEFNQFIDVVPSKHHHRKPPSDNNGHD